MKYNLCGICKWNTAEEMTTVARKAGFVNEKARIEEEQIV